LSLTSKKGCQEEKTVRGTEEEDHERKKKRQDHKRRTEMKKRPTEVMEKEKQGEKDA